MQLDMFGNEIPHEKKTDIKKEFVKVKDLVQRVLRDYPETRDSDTRLYFKCLRVLGVKSIKDAEDLNLNIISVHKTRQIVQNKMGLYAPSKDIKAERVERAEDARDFMRGAKWDV